MDAQDLLQEALRSEAPAQQALLDGDVDTACTGFAAAAECYRRSWELAGQRSFGRLIGMLKARILAGDGDALEEAARYVRYQVPDPDSPTAWYAVALAAAVLGDRGVARNAADGMMPGGDAFRRAAGAVRALADRDDDALRTACQTIREDFAQREEHLTGVPIPDTAIMFERLGARAR
jgi:predicted Zn-dependent protease